MKLEWNNWKIWNFYALLKGANYPQYNDYEIDNNGYDAIKYCLRDDNSNSSSLQMN